MSEVLLSFDVARALARITGGPIRRAQVALDVQVLKDSNFFCPEDTGELQASAVRETVPGSGLIVWATEYARPQYFDRPNKSLDRNPNARMRWFEEARARWGVDWVRRAQEAIRG